MPDGMLQTILALSELQERRKSRAQQDSQFKQSMEVELAKLGITKQSENYRQVTKALEDGINASNDVRKNYGAVLDAMKLPADAKASILQALITAPETAANFQNRQQQAGMASLPPDQQQQVQQEAARVGLTGMNSGGMAQAGMLAQIAGGQMSPEWLKQLQTGFQAQAGKPMEGAMEQAGVNTPGMAQRAAGINFGGRMTDAQAAGQALGQSQFGLATAVQAQEAASRIAALSQKEGLKPHEVIQGLTDVGGVLKMIQDPGQYGMRKYNIARYNSLIRMLGDPNLIQMNPGDDPSAARQAYAKILEGLGLRNPTPEPMPTSQSPRY